MTYVGIPETETDSLHPRDHNQPPLDQLIVEQFNDAIDGVDGFRKRISDLLAKKGALPDVDDEDSAGRMSDMVKITKAAIARLDDLHGSIKEPYLAATRAIDGARRGIKDELLQVEREARDKLDSYVREQERKRREAEAAEERRLAALREEQAARLAAEAHGVDESVEAMVARIEDDYVPRAPAPAKSQPVARGDYGSRLGATLDLIVEIVDVKKVPKAILMNPKVQDAIVSVAKAQVKAGVTTIPGIKITETVKASVR